METFASQTPRFNSSLPLFTLNLIWAYANSRFLSYLNLNSDRKFEILRKKGWLKVFSRQAMMILLCMTTNYQLEVKHQRKERAFPSAAVEAHCTVGPRLLHGNFAVLLGNLKAKYDKNCNLCKKFYRSLFWSDLTFKNSFGILNIKAKKNCIVFSSVTVFIVKLSL